MDDDLMQDEAYFVAFGTWIDYALLRLGLVRYRMALGMRNAARMDGVRRATSYLRPTFPSPATDQETT